MKYKINYNPGTKRWRIYNADSAPLKCYGEPKVVEIKTESRLAMQVSDNTAWLYVEGELEISGDVATITNGG
jgi:hypothetical protein